MSLSLSGTQTQGNNSSPFARLPSDPSYAPLNLRPDWNLDAYSYSDYSLRFSTRELSGQVIASAQGGPASGLAISIDQAWIKASFGEGWGLAFGRRELKWKDGGYWNPSDVANNSLAWNATGAPRGRDSIEITGLLPFMDFNLDVSAATALESGVENPLKLPYYLAAGSILYPLELRAKAAFQWGRLPMVGAAAKLTLSSGNLYVDGLWLREAPLANSGASALDPSFPSEGNWLRYCLGGDWTLNVAETRIGETLMMRVEYLRQDDGLDADGMGKYLDGLDAMPLASASDGAAYAKAAGAWGGRFFALGRNYLNAGATLGGIANQHLSLTEGIVLNIDDLSFALRSSLSWTPRNLVTISLEASNYGGKAGGEALALPYSAQYSLSLSRSF
jgi:hypothetical protein